MDVYKRCGIKTGTLSIFILTLVLVSGSVFAIENKGEKEIRLNGGNSGPVPFPHHRHQDNLGDCTNCHSLFPQEAGAIDRLKTQGKLAKKQVMNKLCLQCHRANKAAGETKYGPITCSKCHQKK